MPAGSGAGDGRLYAARHKSPPPVTYHAAATRAGAVSPLPQTMAAIRAADVITIGPALFTRVSFQT